jgi:hypothetical protein
MAVVVAVISLFGLGLTVAVLTGTSAHAQGDTTTTIVSVSTDTVGSTGTATAGGGTGENGSTWLFVVLVLGLAVFFAVPYVLDVLRTHRRWDAMLAAAKADGLTADELREFATLTPLGIDGLARSLMAFGVIGILGSALFYVLVQTPTQNSGTIISNLLSTLGTLATAIIAFYFGTRAAQAGAAGDVGQPTPTPAAVPKNTAAPTIEGTPMTGSTLTAKPGVWSGLPTTFDYQLQREGDADVWATTASTQSYLIGPDDAGHRVRVGVTATNAAGTSEAAFSKPAQAS